MSGPAEADERVATEIGNEEAHLLGTEHGGEFPRHHLDRIDGRSRLDQVEHRRDRGLREPPLGRRGCIHGGRGHGRNGVEGVCGMGAGEDVVGEVDEAEVVVAGVVAQRQERLVHVETRPLGHHPLGLLDDDAAVEGVLELLVHDLGLADDPMVQDGDGGDVGQGLGRVHVGLAHLARVDAEQVEGADDGAPQPHRQGVHRVEPGGEGFGREPGPATVDRGQVLVHDRLAGAVAVEARAFLGLQLEQLEQAHRLAGRRHHPEVAVGRDEHQPGGGDVEHVDAAVGEQGEQLDHVEVVDQGVGQLHECPGEQCFSGHCGSSQQASAMAVPSGAVPHGDASPPRLCTGGRGRCGRPPTAPGPSRRFGHRSAGAGRPRPRPPG